MGRNGYGPKWSWAEMTSDQTDDTGYPHDGRADKDSYPHDGHADKDSYPHDRHKVAATKRSNTYLHTKNSQAATMPQLAAAAKRHARCLFATIHCEKPFISIRVIINHWAIFSQILNVSL